MFRDKTLTNYKDFELLGYKFATVFNFKKKSVINFPWKDLMSAEGLDSAIEDSKARTVVLFKHSARCGISSMALDRLNNSEELANQEDNVDFYYLDLLTHRPISNQIARRLDIEHQSPQIIVLQNGKVKYHDSHGGIQAAELLKQISSD